jgi:2'-deoxynucleoside 5'-phosphate N-hydrolase
MKIKFNKIYVSGALTHAGKKQRRIYEKIGEICRQFSDTVYIPHLKGTDPAVNKKVSPQDVWKQDHYQVASSDLAIAYVGEPSLGVGCELEIARVTHSSIILWWFKGQMVSRMALGNPYVKVKLEVRDERDLCKKIKKALEKL